MPDTRGPLAPLTAPDLNFHLKLLEEWNEEHVFLPLTTCTMQTDRGIMVMQEVQCSYKQLGYEWDEDEQRDKAVVEKLVPVDVFQLCAVYGDEESLAKLVTFENQGPKHTEASESGSHQAYTIPGVHILVDHTIRA